MYSAGYDVNGTIAEKNKLFERNYKYCIIFFYFIGMLCCVFCKYGIKKNVTTNNQKMNNNNNIEWLPAMPFVTFVTFLDFLRHFSLC